MQRTQINAKLSRPLTTALKRPRSFRPIRVKKLQSTSARKQEVKLERAASITTGRLKLSGTIVPASWLLVKIFEDQTEKHGVQHFSTVSYLPYRHGIVEAGLRESKSYPEQC